MSSSSHSNFTPFKEIKQYTAKFTYEIGAKSRPNVYNGIVSMAPGPYQGEDISVFVFESDDNASKFINPLLCFWENTNFIQFRFKNKSGPAVTDGKVHVITERVHMDLDSFLNSKLKEFGGSHCIWWVLSSCYFHQIFKGIWSGYNDIFKMKKIAFQCSATSISVDKLGNTKILGVEESNQVNRVTELRYLGSLMHKFVTAGKMGVIEAPENVKQLINDLNDYDPTKVPDAWLLDNCVFWGLDEVRPWIENLASLIEEWSRDGDMIAYLDNALLKILKRPWTEFIPTDPWNKLRQGFNKFLKDKQLSVKDGDEFVFNELAKFYRNTFVHYEQDVDEMYKIHDAGVCEVVEKCFESVGGLCFVLRNALEKALFRDQEFNPKWMRGS